MGTLLLIIAIIFVLGLGCGAVFLFLFQKRAQPERDQPAPATKPTPPGFCWRYIALPLTVFLLSIIVVAYFSRLLPPEAAYHFQDDGTPDRWMARNWLILWALLPQFFLTVLAAAITWGAARLGAMFNAGNTGVDLGRVLLVMGNMVGLPQLILGFAMLDIFSYNAYQVHLLPLWLFALIVMALGTIGLGVFFFQTLRQVGGSSR